MVEQDKTDRWDEVLEETDELAGVHKDPLGAPSGTSRNTGSKSEKKPRFSLRGYNFAPLDVKTENVCIVVEESTSGLSTTKASETMMAERLENIEEEAEDLPPECAFATHKANTSVSELLEDLQGRSGSSVKEPALLHQHMDTAIRKQEVSSEVTPTEASQIEMAELLENTKEDTEDLPSEVSHMTKKANISVAELLEDLQGRSGCSVGAASSLHQHTRAKDRKSKLASSGKKTWAILGDRSHDSEDPLEHVTDGTSSEEEEVLQDHLDLVSKDVKQQTMTDLFQEVFDPANMEGTMLPVRATGAGYCRRMQKIMQMEKDRHAEFLRQYNREQGCSKGITVQIMSRSLEGKLAVCHCLLQQTSNLALTSNASTDQTMDENRTKWTIIFSPKICDNVDLLVGNMIHIFPPWKEVRVQEENVILCTYFSHHGAQ